MYVFRLGSLGALLSLLCCLVAVFVSCLGLASPHRDPVTFGGVTGILVWVVLRRCFCRLSLSSLLRVPCSSVACCCFGRVCCCFFRLLLYGLPLRILVCLTPFQVTQACFVWFFSFVIFDSLPSCNGFSLNFELLVLCLILLLFRTYSCDLVETIRSVSSVYARFSCFKCCRRWVFAAFAVSPVPVSNCNFMRLGER